MAGLPGTLAIGRFMDHGNSIHWRVCMAGYQNGTGSMDDLAVPLLVFHPILLSLGGSVSNAAGGTTTTWTSTAVTVQLTGPAATNSATNSASATTRVSSPFTNTKLSPLGWGLVLIGGAIGGVSTVANFIALVWFGM